MYQKSLGVHGSSVLTVKVAGHNLFMHTHNTRFASDLNFHRPKANNNYGTSTFAFISSKLWETILTSFKKLPLVTLSSTTCINYTF